jgi:thioredoxin reductase
MESIETANGVFLVKTTRGTYRTGAVLLAIGRRGTPRKLGVPGEELPKVVYRLIDPEQYRGQCVLIVGGGDSAVEAAVALSDQPGTLVTLCYRGEAFNRVKEKNRQLLHSVSATRRVRILLNSNVARIDPDRVVLDQAGSPLELANDKVIISAGGVLPTELLKQVGVAFELKRGTA